jgi:hyperosmotically inducible protein
MTATSEAPVPPWGEPEKHLRRAWKTGENMKTNFVASTLLLGALLVPGWAFAADSSKDTPGQYLDDAAITAKVKAAFAEDKWVKGRDISVRTDHGVVDLTGAVGSKDELERATALATKVKAVNAVHNNLTVSAHQ